MNSHLALTLACPTEVQCLFLFVDGLEQLVHSFQNTISIADCEEGEGYEDEKTIPFSFLISKIKSFEKYRLDSSFLFHISETDLEKFSSMEPDEIQRQHFKHLPFLNDIVLSASLSLFHPLSSLIFIMKEKPHKHASFPKIVFDTEQDASHLASVLDVSQSLQKTKKTRPDYRRKTIRALK